jgi:hypothetical protein
MLSLQEELAKIEVECDDDAILGERKIDDFLIAQVRQASIGETCDIESKPLTEVGSGARSHIDIKKEPPHEAATGRFAGARSNRTLA